MLKFDLKKDHLNFMQNWVTPETHMTKDDPDEDLLHNLLKANFQDGFSNPSTVMKTSRTYFHHIL